MPHSQSQLNIQHHSRLSVTLTVCVPHSTSRPDDVHSMSTKISNKHINCTRNAKVSNSSQTKTMAKTFISRSRLWFLSSRRLQTKILSLRTRPPTSSETVGKDRISVGHQSRSHEHHRAKQHAYGWFTFIFKGTTLLNYIHIMQEDTIQQQQPFNGLCSGTTRVGRYQKKHSAFCLSIELCCVQAGFPYLLSSGFLWSRGR